MKRIGAFSIAPRQRGKRDRLPPSEAFRVEYLRRFAADRSFQFVFTAGRNTVSTVLNDAEETVYPANKTCCRTTSSLNWMQFHFKLDVKLHGRINRQRVIATRPGYISRKHHNDRSFKYRVF